MNNVGRFVAAWGSSADDVYMGGTNILHYDGSVWEGLGMNRSFGVMAMSGVDQDRVYAVGPNQILRFSRGGWGWVDLTWTSLTTLNGVAAFAGGEVYVSSYEGGIMRSTDEGLTWDWVHPGSGTGRIEESGLTALWAPDPKHLFFTARDSSLSPYGSGVWSSSNAGRSWRSRIFPDERWLGHVWGTGDSVYVVGSTILHSGDAGDHWEVQLAKPPQLLNSVGGSGPDDVYAVGEKRTVLHTGDRGVTWNLVDVGTQLDLLSVWSSACDDVYIGGDHGLILHGH